MGMLNSIWELLKFCGSIALLISVFLYQAGYGFDYFSQHYFDETHYVGADGHRIKIYHNESAHDPTYNEMLEFIDDDSTDANPYNPGSFVCADYAEQVQNNAEDHGLKCAFVYVTFSDKNECHACNAFNTTDKGLVFIDCTNSANEYNTISDCTVSLVDGESYRPVYLFNNDRLHCDSMGIVKSHKVDWGWSLKSCFYSVLSIFN
jgi:hypothetical protein